jgi:alanine transaminase
VPIPQYPLYTATLALLDGKVVPYVLDEEQKWGTNLSIIRDAVTKAESEGTNVRAIVVINPGNPTGASLDEENIGQILEYAAEKKLVVMADEVYQTNIFEGKFFSFKKVLRDLQKATPGKYDNIELVSMHSISKGMVGECGHRGGYFELVGFNEEVVAQIYKFVSISLCPPVIGQCLVELMTNPPKEGDESYALYKEEYDGIFEGLKKRAYALYEAFQKMEGVKCQSPQVSSSSLCPNFIYCVKNDD